MDGTQDMLAATKTLLRLVRPCMRLHFLIPHVGVLIQSIENQMVCEEEINALVAINTKLRDFCGTHTQSPQISAVVDAMHNLVDVSAPLILSMTFGAKSGLILYPSAPQVGVFGRAYPTLFRSVLDKFVETSWVRSTFPADWSSKKFVEFTSMPGPELWIKKSDA